ncbi:hypothetical protein LPJ66_007737, partial [Kickxella alabastrina]
MKQLTLAARVGVGAGYKQRAAVAVAMAKAAMSTSAKLSGAAPETTKLFINGEFVESQASEWIDVHNPATQEVVTRVPRSTKHELDEAAHSAQLAFGEWRRTSVLTRQRKMLDLQHAIRGSMDALAASIVTQQGKVLADARGDVQRGLQVVES